MEMLIYNLPLIIIVATSPTKVVQLIGNMAPGIQNMWSFRTPCLQVTWHRACVVISFAY